MTPIALKLYHAAPSRSSIVLWMLEELGEPYELEVLSLKDNDQLKPSYRAINPMGKVPTLVDEGVAITEVAAICCHLADKYSKAGLAPATTDPMRGPYLHWLFWAPSCLEPAIIDHVLKRAQAPRGMQGWIDYDTTIDILTGGRCQRAMDFGRAIYRCRRRRRIGGQLGFDVWDDPKAA